MEGQKTNNQREMIMGMLDLKPSKKALKSQSGFYFCPVAGLAEIFNKDRRYKEAKLTVCLVFSAEKKPIEYVLLKDFKPIYANTSYEAVAYRADIHILANKSAKR